MWGAGVVSAPPLHLSGYLALHLFIVILHQIPIPSSHTLTETQMYVSAQEQTYTHPAGDTTSLVCPVATLAIEPRLYQSPRLSQLGEESQVGYSLLNV